MDHDHHHNHNHGHRHDAGLKGFLRYLRFAPKMWRSPVNAALVDVVDPQPGEVVIDLGAGYGAAAVLALSRGATVVAVDPTTSMRLVMKVRRLVQKRRKLLSVMEGAAESLPAEDASVNAVYSNNTMHHWADQRQAATEIRRVLKPGGRLVLSDELFNDPEHSAHETTGKRFDPESQHHHGMTMVDGQEMAEVFAEAGMVNCEAGRSLLAGEPAVVVTAEAPA